jgi:hypothetical protein
LRSTVASSRGTRQWRAGILDVVWGSGEGIRRRRTRLLRRGSTDGGQDHDDELRRQAEYGAVREREESVRERTREEERERVRAFL